MRRSSSSKNIVSLVSPDDIDTSLNTIAQAILNDKTLTDSQRVEGLRRLRSIHTALRCGTAPQKVNLQLQQQQQQQQPKVDRNKSISPNNNNSKKSSAASPPPIKRPPPVTPEVFEAWNELCRAAKAEVSEDELKLLSLDTLQRLVHHYRLDRNIVVATRIELMWRHFAVEREAERNKEENAIELTQVVQNGQQQQQKRKTANEGSSTNTKSGGKVITPRSSLAGQPKERSNTPRKTNKVMIKSPIQSPPPPPPPATPPRLRSSSTPANSPPPPPPLPPSVVASVAPRLQKDSIEPTASTYENPLIRPDSAMPINSPKNHLWKHMMPPTPSPDRVMQQNYHNNPNKPSPNRPSSSPSFGQSDVFVPPGEYTPPDSRRQQTKSTSPGSASKGPRQR
eukprot:PhF_6_TR11316/c0_g1_i1/m.18267